MAPPPGPVYSFLHALPIPSLPYNIEHWVPGSTPISTVAEVTLAMVVYLVVIFGGQALMRGSKPYRESLRAQTGPPRVGGACGRRVDGLTRTA